MSMCLRVGQMLWSDCRTNVGRTNVGRTNVGRTKVAASTNPTQIFVSQIPSVQIKQREK
jgi:hypothetical protein